MLKKLVAETSTAIIKSICRININIYITALRPCFYEDIIKSVYLVSVIERSILYDMTVRFCTMFTSIELESSAERQQLISSQLVLSKLTIFKVNIYQRCYFHGNQIKSLAYCFHCNSFVNSSSETIQNRQ